ncbi:MAG: beta-Ala-His dipeptidase [Succinatimonas sp.]|nr:beta-Ala-His dipeptidase [Succinatimonas sp.]
MGNEITNLEPKAVWSYFNKLTNIPRPSGHEENVAKFICDFAKEHGFDYTVDEVGSVIIEVPATLDKKDAPLVILQGHMDMVPVVEDGFTHDFLKDPIDAYIDDDFVKAHHTTLGADNGIAIALTLAMLEDKSLSHGPIRAIFTVEEETSMKGAFNLDKKYLQGDYLINLDSEDNGFLFVNCAGSYDVSVKFNFDVVELDDVQGLSLTINQLAGGHSGADIHLGHANAIKLMATILDDLSDDFDFFVKSLDGGFVRNSIPAKVTSVIAVPNAEKENFLNAFKQCFESQKELYKATDPDMALTVENTEVKSAMGYAQSLDLIHLVRSLPSGIIRMSPDFKNIVETSINLGVAVTSKQCIDLCMLGRSLNDTALSDIINTVKAHCYLLDNVDVVADNRHEPWSSPSQNRLIDVLNESYQQVTGSKFEITALHAGVECANFAKKNEALQLISIGPTILNPHSIKERVDIKGVNDIYLTVRRALAML